MAITVGLCRFFFGLVHPPTKSLCQNTLPMARCHGSPQQRSHGGGEVSDLDVKRRGMGFDPSPVCVYGTYYV